MSYHKFDNIVSLGIRFTDNVEEIVQWCEEFIGLSWYSPKPGPKMWAARSVPYAVNDLDLRSELTVSFANESDATMFALRWIK